MGYCRLVRTAKGSIENAELWEMVALPQHVRHDEESDMTPPNVDLIEMTNSAVTRGDGDVF